MSAKPITPVAWHPLDAILGGESFSRACEALCGGADSVEAQAAIKAATARRMNNVEDGVAAVVASILGSGVPDIEITLAHIGVVLIATAKASLLLRGRDVAEIDVTIHGIERTVQDETVLRALDQLQRGHGGAS